MKKDLYRKGRHFYKCETGYCDITITMHPTGAPVGVPVGRQARELRSLAHKLATKIWQYDDVDSRKKMYQWLDKNSMSGHIGMMDENELVPVIEKLERIIKKFIDK